MSRIVGPAGTILWMSPPWREILALLRYGSVPGDTSISCIRWRKAASVASQVPETRRQFNVVMRSSCP
jgi:hypothetical protein